MSTPKTVSPLSGITYGMVERRTADLRVDPSVQRSLRKARVKLIAKEFRPEALGVLTTSHRADGGSYVIDGQHRLRAAETVGYEGVIQTMQYEGLTVPQEAALFRLLNATEKVSKVDEFLIACVEQDIDALRLAKFIADHGWSVGSSVAKSRLSAIGSLQRVYKRSPEAAEGTLAVLTSAYGHEADTVQGVLIEGVGIFLAKYGRAVDLTEFATRLSKVPSKANGIVATARGHAYTRVGTLSSHVAREVHGIYNKGLRSRALPAWDA